MSVAASHGRLRRPPLPRGPPAHFHSSHSIASQFASSLQGCRNSFANLQPLKPLKRTKKPTLPSSTPPANGSVFKVPTLPTSVNRSPIKLPVQNINTNPSTLVAPVSPTVGKLEKKDPWPGEKRATMKKALLEVRVTACNSELKRKFGLIRCRKKMAENEHLYEFIRGLGGVFERVGDPKRSGLGPLIEKTRRKRVVKDDGDKRARKRRRMEEERRKEREMAMEDEDEEGEINVLSKELEEKRKSRSGGSSPATSPNSVMQESSKSVRKDKTRSLEHHTSSELKKKRREAERDKHLSESRKRKREHYESARDRHAVDSTRRKKTPSPKDDSSMNRGTRSAPKLRTAPYATDGSKSVTVSRRSSPGSQERPRSTKAKVNFRSSQPPTSPANSSSGSRSVSSKKDEIRKQDKIEKRSVSPRSSAEVSPTRRKVSASSRERPLFSSVPNPVARKEAGTPSSDNLGTPGFSPAGGSGKQPEQKQVARVSGRELRIPAAKLDDAEDVVTARNKFLTGKEEVERLMEKGQYIEAEKVGIRVFADGFNWGLMKETQYRRRRAASRGRSDAVAELREESKECESVYHYVASGFAKKLMKSAQHGGRAVMSSIYSRNLSKAYGRMYILPRMWQNEKKAKLRQLSQKLRGVAPPRGITSEDWRTLQQAVNDQLEATNYYELASQQGADGGEDAGNECRMM